MELVDLVVGVKMLKRQYSEIILGPEAPAFYCMLLLGVAMIVLPIYGYKVFKMIILYP